MSIAARLDRLSVPEPMSGCWLWLGATIWGGYGRIKFGDRHQLAHRVSYEVYTGHPIPAGMTIDHLCRTRSCINPTHLEVVTQQENVLRGQGLAAHHAKKTACVQGHPFSPENTITGKRPSWRVCRQCKLVSDRDYKRRARSLTKPLDGGVVKCHDWAAKVSHRHTSPVLGIPGAGVGVSPNKPLDISLSVPL